MKEDKTKILTMLTEGKIDVAEAEKLLNAIDQPDRDQSLEKRHSGTLAQFLNILVESDKEDGTRVKIKVPLYLMKAGMKFAKVIPEKSMEKAQTAMRKKGIHFDLNNINSSNMDELLEALQDLEIFVDDSETGEKVRIFCE